MSNEKYDDLFTAEDEKPIDYKAILFEWHNWSNLRMLLTH